MYYKITKEKKEVAVLIDDDVNNEAWKTTLTNNSKIETEEKQRKNQDRDKRKLLK